MARALKPTGPAITPDRNSRIGELGSGFKPFRSPATVTASAPQAADESGAPFFALLSLATVLFAVGIGIGALAGLAGILSLVFPRVGWPWLTLLAWSLFFICTTQALKTAMLEDRS